MKIPFQSFDKINAQIKGEVLENFEAFFDAKKYVLGSQVEEFENRFASYCCTDHCIGVGNGLDAIKLSLLALNIGEGDEVIVPANTYIATVLAVSHTGAIPVFVEPNVKTYNIDPKKIEKSISKKTKAIIPVHLYGQPCEMDKIMSIAENYNLYVIEDNAQAQGATFKNKLTGSFGSINATSFYPTKNLGALGDAGAITTNDEKLMERCRSLRNYGSLHKNYNDEIGYNSRLDELQAGVLSIKLSYLNKWNQERRKIASWYKELLGGVERLILPVEINRAESVFHLFVIRMNNRDGLKKYLEKKNVQTMIHYPIPSHLQKAYKYLLYKEGRFPISEELSETSLSLPIFVGMTKNQVVYISDLIIEFMKVTKLK